AADMADLNRIRSTAKLPGFKASDWPVLAKTVVRHVGEPVAMALGRTPAEAEDLAPLVEVEYAPKQAIVTMKEAVAPGRPLVHDHGAANVLLEPKMDFGHVAPAQAAAKHVVTREFRMNRQTPLAMEGRGCVAVYDSRRDEMVLYIAHQLQGPLQI